MHLSKLLIPTAIILASTAAATASAAPIMSTNQACYLVGQRVAIAGSGFAPSRMYEVAVDNVNFGLKTTDAFGAFTASLIPGGLGANVVEALHVLSASDGTSMTRTRFVVTRKTGARVLPGTGGTARTFRAPIQVWGFALVHGKPAPSVVPPKPLPVYVHYLGPRRKLRETVTLGRTGGPCGYLKTARRRVFPFAPARGTWTLQVDTSATYSRLPAGPVAKIKLLVR